MPNFMNQVASFQYILATSRKYFQCEGPCDFQQKRKLKHTHKTYKQKKEQLLKPKLQVSRD